MLQRSPAGGSLCVHGTLFSLSLRRFDDKYEICPIYSGFTRNLFAVYYKNNQNISCIHFCVFFWGGGPKTFNIIFVAGYPEKVYLFSDFTAIQP